jgi:hypothetical protein
MVALKLYLTLLFIPLSIVAAIISHFLVKDPEHKQGAVEPSQFDGDT